MIGALFTRNVTVPVGVGVPVSVAAKTAAAPEATGLAELVRAKVAGVAVPSTATDRAVETADGAKGRVPEVYWALTDTVPPVPEPNVGVNVQLAPPALSAAAAQGVDDEAPIAAVNVTVPVGSPLAPDTVADTVIGAW